MTHRQLVALQSLGERGRQAGQEVGEFLVDHRLRSGVGRPEDGQDRVLDAVDDHTVFVEIHWTGTKAEGVSDNE